MPPGPLGPALLCIRKGNETVLFLVLILPHMFLQNKRAVHWREFLSKTSLRWIMGGLNMWFDPFTQYALKQLR